MWKFSLKDFQGSYSIYTLKAVSRIYRPFALLFFASMTGLLLIVLVFVLIGMKRYKPRHYDDKPKKRS